MSEERETPAARAAETPDTPANLGAPVAETAASETEVLEAVERATGSPAEALTESNVQTQSDPDHAAAQAASAAGGEAPTGATNSHESESVGAAVSQASVHQGAEPAVEDQGVAPTPELAEEARRQAISEVDTQLNIDMSAGATDPTLGLDALPSAGADEVRDGEIRVAADHPMAGLYMQSPMPPEIRGNRGMGVLIALLACIGFAIVSAGVVAVTLAPKLAPSQFVDGLLAELLSWAFIAGAVAFFVGLAVLVLIVGRAGWWAYVLGGFFVGLLVWVATVAGLAVDESGLSVLLNVSPLALLGTYGLSLPAIAAGVVGREVTVWFGAWIGARGRRVKARNAAELAEYEAALAEVQAK
ncbi:hypothetical protein ACXR2W_00190 [Leucobacter sp. HY1908]